MTSRNIEFGVETVIQIPGGARAVGRIHHGAIRVGDAFSVAFKLTPERTSVGYSSSLRSADRPVSIRIEEIRAYGRGFEELDAGLTAELVLSGDDAVTLVRGDVLGGCAP